ncbi:unnamed protein product [Paramecium octaurelia]|uniref:Uncharacterized protein n=1 Tax=Paramecium octaurelia TaxID=43137 RepID=A0A8S1T047_PAROT|nr:unnamed protein product [Paramecium octaurelia]
MSSTGNLNDKFDTSFVYLFKYIIIGDMAVGKSCLLMQFIDKRFRSKHDVTIGVEFGARIIRIQNVALKLSIWDTAGQESFRSITRSYYRSSAAAIIVYDITKRNSFENVVKWLDDARENGNKQITFLLVGNKNDLEQERQVSFEEAKQFAQDNEIGFMETSAKTNYNVDQMFTKLAEIILFKIQKGIIDPKNESFGVRVGSEYQKYLASISNDSKQDEKEKNQKVDPQLEGKYVQLNDPAVETTKQKNKTCC